MVDFIRSFEAGVSAAQHAEESKREINSVFEELNRQLATATHNKIAIRPMEFRDPWMAFTMLAKKGTVDASKYMALAVIPKQGGGPEEIARWEISETGYPCKISFSTNVWECANKEGLERALGQLLQNPLIAKTIQETINTNPGEATDRVSQI